MIVFTHFPSFHFLDTRLSRVTPSPPLSIGSIKRIHLIWSVRSRDLLNSFSYLLVEKVREASGSSIQIILHLYVTASQQITHENEKRGDLESATNISNRKEIKNVVKIEFKADHGVEARGATSSAEVKYGRPAYDELFRAIAVGSQSSSQISTYVACLVCGPESMIDDVSNLSFKHNFYFQAEEFSF